MSLLCLKSRIVLAAFIAVVLVFPALVCAEEVQYPVLAYTSEELAKVREWEKTWVGKTVDKSNIDQVAQFLPEGFVRIFKEQEKWCPPPEGFSFTITPYKQAAITNGDEQKLDNDHTRYGTAKTYTHPSHHGRQRTG